MMNSKKINRLFIVMYHYTRDLVHSRYPHIKGLDLPLFREQLEFFKQNFNVVTMEDVLDSLAYSSTSSAFSASVPASSSTSSLTPSLAPLSDISTPPPTSVLSEIQSAPNIVKHSSNDCGNDGTDNSDRQAAPALLLTFDDGYIDNYTYALPLLEEFGFQGSFFIPGKTFTEHKLLDVNKIHYILAAAEDQANGINQLVTDLFDKMNYYRGKEYSFPSNEELYTAWAVPNRFDSGDVVFIKRILQTVLPEELRNRISSDLFESYVGISEEKLAYELYMTETQIKSLKKRGMYIGLHGYDHYWLGRLSNSEMKADIDKALSVMNGLGVIEQDKWVMNYPYGNYNEAVLDYIKERGAVLGVTTEVNVAEIGKDDRFKIPRLDCNDFPPKSERYKELAS